MVCFSRLLNICTTLLSPLLCWHDHVSVRALHCSSLSMLWSRQTTSTVRLQAETA
jgi:hypothetical protein